MSKIMHVSGFVDDGRPTGVHVSSYDGELSKIATGVLNAIHHPKRTETIRSLDGWLKEVRAYIDVNGTEMWHVFLTESEPWPTADATASPLVERVKENN